MDRFFGLDREAPHDDNLVAVGTYYDNPSLSLALARLTDADIPYLSKKRGCGSAMQILAGYNMYGTDVFVREEDADAALALLAPADEEEAAPEAEEEETSPEEV